MGKMNNARRIDHMGTQSEKNTEQEFSTRMEVAISGDAKRKSRVKIPNKLIDNGTVGPTPRAGRRLTCAETCVPHTVLMRDVRIARMMISAPSIPGNPTTWA